MDVDRLAGGAQFVQAHLAPFGVYLIRVPFGIFGNPFVSGPRDLFGPY